MRGEVFATHAERAHQEPTQALGGGRRIHGDADPRHAHAARLVDSLDRLIGKPNARTVIEAPPTDEPARVAGGGSRHRAQGRVEATRLTKVFGDRPDHALELLEAGSEPGEIFDQTGMTVAVRQASFSVGPGEILVVMGLSGSGKSTLLRMVNRLIDPTAGEVTVDGRPLQDLSVGCL